MSDPKKFAADEKHVSKFDLGGMYFRSVDLLIDGAFRVAVLTVCDFFPAGSQKAADGRPIEKPIICFSETPKRMVLNATNQELLHLIAGGKTGKDAIGHKVRIAARACIGFGSEIELGIRIMPPPGMLLRKGVKKHLGTAAEWQGQAKNGAEFREKEQPAPTTTVVENAGSELES